jgi:hypothetical protein
MLGFCVASLPHTTGRWLLLFFHHDALNASHGSRLGGGLPPIDCLVFAGLLMRPVHFVYSMHRIDGGKRWGHWELGGGGSATRFVWFVCLLFGLKSQPPTR